MTTRSAVLSSFFAFVAAACGAVASPPPAPERKLTVSTELVSFALRNGARVLLASDDTTDLVLVAARYDVGAIDDPPGKQGLAHLAEHLVFLSREGDRRLDSQLGEVALGYNAYTTLDVTHYYSIARETELAALLAVEARRMAPGACNSITPEDFAREREVVLNELRTRHRRGDITPLLMETIYPAGHPYRRNVGGDETQVASITQDEVCAFVAQYYVPAQATFVITGNASKSQVEVALDATVGASRGRPPSARKRPPAAVKQPSVTRRAPVDSARVVMSWPLPPMLTRERAAASMAMKQLSRRVGAQVSKHDLALSVEVSTSGGEFAPVAVVALQLTDSTKPEDAIAAVRTAIGKLGTKDAKHELVSINARTVTELVSGFDSLGGRADRFADYLQLVNGEHGYFVEELERHAKVTDAEIAAAGKRVFDPAAATTLIIVPDTETAAEYQQVGLTFASNMTHETSGHEIPVDPAEAAAPLGVPISKSRLHEARHFTLGNGMDVYLLPSSAVPIVDVRLQFRAGSAAEPDDKAGVAYIAAQMLETDFDRISRSEATDALNFFRVGGEIDVSVDDDNTTFRMVGLEGYSDVLLAGLERMIKVGVYDPDEIENYRKRIAGLLADSDVADFQAHGRALAEAVYGAEHPYARRGFWTADSVRRIDMSAARAFKDRYFVASNASLIITGKFDADLIERHVRYRFGPWPRGDASAHELPSPIGRGSHVGVVNAHRPTLSIDIAYPAPAPGADYAAWLVLEAMLGGRVAGVREEMGASYGMSADLATHRGAGMLVVSGPVDGRRAGAALVAVRRAIDELRADDADFDSSFALARRTVVARLASATNSAGSTGAQLAFTASHRKLPSYLSHLVQEVATLTPKEIRALATRALAPERQSIVLHGPRAAIQAAFTEAGITRARIIGR